MGVNSNSSLNFKFHINKIINKSSVILGFIKETHNIVHNAYALILDTVFLISTFLIGIFKSHMVHKFYI